MAPTTWGYKQPLHYEYDVLTNLEEFNLKSAEKAKSDKKDFKAIINGLDSSAEKIVSSISDEAEKSRIQAQINAEKIEAGISETNYRLLNISYNIGSLEKQVKLTGDEIVKNLEITNSKLSSIDSNLLLINSSLKDIGNILSDMLRKISNPNEVSAFEIIDQIRINLAIGKKDEALRLSIKAIELSSTSIPVLAYHIMSLSLFNDELHVNQSKEAFNDFVNLINFKLYDAKSDTKSIREEIYYFVYPVLFSLSKSLGAKILTETQHLYSYIISDPTATEMILSKPLEDKQTAEMTFYPSPLRELHWTVILKEEIISNKSFEKLIKYIPAVATSNILIKTELLMLANKQLFESEVLYNILNKTWQENTATTKELECLKIFISMQPQDNFQLDDKAIFLINRFVIEKNLEINSTFQKILDTTSSKLKIETKQYLDKWLEANETIREIEKEVFPKVEKKAQELLKKNNNSKISELKKEIENLNKKSNKIANEEHFYDYDNARILEKRMSIISIISIIILIVLALNSLFSSTVGFWSALLFVTPVVLVIGGIALFLVPLIAKFATQLLTSILRFSSGRTTRGIVSTNHQLYDQIQIRKEKKKEKEEENRNDFLEVVMVAFKISSYGEIYLNELMDNYKQIITAYFHNNLSEDKVHKAIKPMINGNFPNKLKLSDDFYSKLFRILSDFKDPELGTELETETIQDRLLFKKNITLEDIENSDFNISAS